MAIIPDSQKIHTLDASVDTTERGSARVNSLKQVYTITDFKETLGAPTFTEVDVTPAELQVIGDTPKQLLPAPTAGKYYDVDKMILEFTTDSAGGLANDLTIDAGGIAIVTILSTFLTSNSQNLVILNSLQLNTDGGPPLRTGDVSGLLISPLLLKSSNPNVDASSAIKVKIWYTERTFG